MCAVLMPPGVNPIAVNKYIIPNHLKSGRIKIYKNDNDI